MRAAEKMALYQVLRQGTERSLVRLLMLATTRQRNAALTDEQRLRYEIIERECRYHLGVHQYWKRPAHQLPLIIRSE